MGIKRIYGSGSSLEGNVGNCFIHESLGVFFSDSFLSVCILNKWVVGRLGIIAVGFLRVLWPLLLFISSLFLYCAEWLSWWNPKNKLGICFQSMKYCCYCKYCLDESKNSCTVFYQSRVGKKLSTLLTGLVTTLMRKKKTPSGFDFVYRSLPCL